MASGQVEKNVQDARHRILQLMPDFPDLAAMNGWLEQRCIELWGETRHGTLPGNIADVWAAERAALMPLPMAFDGFVEQSKRVSPTCLISFERSLPEVTPPEALALSKEPKADVGRHDGLRGREQENRNAS